MNSDQVVHRFRKSSREEVVAALSSFKGLDGADVRVFVLDENGNGRPTPKGVWIRVEQLPHLLAAVSALIAAAERRQAA